MIKLIKHIEKPVQKDCFFFEFMSKEIDSEYFIKKIEEGISSKENKNYKTNVLGKMTSWNWFAKDNNFINIIKPCIDHFDFNKIDIQKCNLRDAWGVKTGYRDKVIKHNHGSAIISDVLYLNNSNQNLFFPQLDIEVKIKKNKIILFSGFLDHYTKLSLEENSKYGISFNFYEIK
jgi:hypothetical protein